MKPIRIQRKRSPATEIRYLRHEVKVRDARIGALLNELEERRRVGVLMSNLCWNGKKNADVPADLRDSMRFCQEAWDGIQRSGQ